MGNRIRDISACSAVPQRTMPFRARSAFAIFFESVYKQEFRIFMTLSSIKCHGSVSRGFAVYIRGQTDREIDRRERKRKVGFIFQNFLCEHIKRKVTLGAPNSLAIPTYRCLNDTLSHNNDIIWNSLKLIWDYTQIYFQLTAQYIVFLCCHTFRPYEPLPSSGSYSTRAYMQRSITICYLLIHGERTEEMTRIFQISA